MNLENVLLNSWADFHYSFLVIIPFLSGKYNTTTAVHDSLTQHSGPPPGDYVGYAVEYMNKHLLFKYQFSWD